MSALIVTAYNVGFGDAILVEFPELVDGRAVRRRLMIDMGNVLAGEGADRDVFVTVAADVLRRLDGDALDLYVMTHEHLDHVRGMRLAASAGHEIPVDHVWLTASADPHYGRRYPRASAQRLAMAAEARRLAADSAGPDERPPRVLFANNDPGETAACVDYLRSMARVRRSYVHSGFKIIPGKHHPFTEARLSVLAPEPDTSTYYGRLASPMPRESGRRRYPPTPNGVDTAAFRKLVRSLQAGSTDNMLAIDRAANNTSVVLYVEWRGWRLLFPGDAEHRSWQTMLERRRLRPVHFLKISHHGSHNGTPVGAALDAILPLERPDDRLRASLVSTWPDTYSGVPDPPTLDRLAARVDVARSTRSVPIGGSVMLEFPDEEASA